MAIAHEPGTVHADVLCAEVDGDDNLRSCAA
jgi:hypothetical protein